MPLQRQILEALSIERALLLDVQQTTHEIKGEVISLSRRVDRIEDRQYQERPAQKPAEPHQKDWTPRDYLMASAGCALVIAAALDKVDWSTVASFISSLK